MVEKQAELQESACDFESIANRYFNALDANEVPDPSYRDKLDSENTDWVFFEQTQTPLLLDNDEIKELFTHIRKGEYSHKEIISGNGNLSSEEKKDLRNDIQRANLAKEIVIYGHLHLVTKIACKYAFNSQLPLMALIQEGNIGLMEAIKKYDPSQKSKFSSYAFYWARRNIINAILTQSRIIRIPIGQVSKVNIYNKQYAQLQNKLGRSPTKSEIAQKMDITEKVLEKLLKGIHEVASLDQLLEKGVLPSNNNHNDIETEIINKEERDRIIEIAYRLPYDLRRVIFLRHGFYDSEYKTFVQISQSLGISKSTIREQYNKGIKQIQMEYNKMEYNHLLPKRNAKKGNR